MQFMQQRYSLAIVGRLCVLALVACEDDTHDHVDRPGSSDNSLAAGLHEGMGPAGNQYDVPGQVVRDSHPDCPIWAGKGECSTNSVYMTRHCPESCAVQTLSMPHGDLDEHDDSGACSAGGAGAQACSPPVSVEHHSGDASLGIGHGPVLAEDGPSHSIGQVWEAPSAAPNEQRRENAAPDQQQAVMDDDKAQSVEHQMDVGASLPASPHAGVQSSSTANLELEASTQGFQGGNAASHGHQNRKEDAEHSVTPEPDRTDDKDRKQNPHATSYEPVQHIEPTIQHIEPSVAPIPSGVAVKPSFSTMPKTSAEWKGAVIAVYSVASTLAQWISVIASEGGAFAVQAVFAEPPLNAVLVIFMTFVLILGVFRGLPTGSSGRQHQLQKQQSAPVQSVAQPVPGSGGASAVTADGEVLSLRAELETLQRQHQQAVLELQRCVADSQHHLHRVSAELTDMRTERNSTDEEICESLKEIFEWIAGVGASTTGKNGQSQDVPNLVDSLTQPKELQCKPSDSNRSSGQEMVTTMGAPLRSNQLDAEIFTAVAGGPLDAVCAAAQDDQLRGVSGKSGTPHHEDAPSADRELGAQPTAAQAARPLQSAAASDHYDLTQAPSDVPDGNNVAGCFEAPQRPLASADVPPTPSPGLDSSSNPGPESVSASRPELGVEPPPALAEVPQVPAQHPQAAAEVDSPDVAAAGGGGLRPQPQEIKASSNPFGGRPQQQPIQASANPFANRPLPQPIQAKSDPFGSRPQPQPIQATANPFGGPR